VFQGSVAMEIGRNLPTQSFPHLKAELANQGKINLNKEELNLTPEAQKVESKEDIAKKIDSINKFISTTNSHLKFSLHEELNEYYVAIIDNRTNEVIKEIPPKKLLDMFAAMKETIGLFIDKKI
jgi:flagellar protein FlaG